MVTKTKNGNILILDDEKTNIDIIKHELKQSYSIYFALHVQHAFEILERVPIDLILLDIVMPELNGFEFYRAIQKKKELAHIKVIFITAKNDIDSVVRGFEAGAVDFITKPFEILELKARVKNHMDLIKAKQQLEEARNNLEILNSTKDRLFSIIGHDLRNPIGGIKSFLELMLYKDTYETQNLKQVFSHLLESSKQAYSLLDELLIWAKAQKDEIRFAPEPHDISQTVSDVLSFSQERAQIKHIHLQTNATESLVAVFDYEMIKTVIRNLVANAIKFTHEQGSVEVHVSRVPNAIQIAVSDTGMGISKENIPKLFDKKSFITTSDTTQSLGTGIGLSICFDFVKKHGGEIWVESEEGKGSTFYFTIPENE